MTFAITAGGDKAETLASLRALDDAELGGDVLGEAVRDLLVRFIDASQLAEEHQVYTVSAVGSSDPEEPLVLQLRVQLGDRFPDPSAPATSGS